MWKFVERETTKSDAMEENEKQWEILWKKITCIFPAGGDTTRKILIVALRKSSCFNPSLPLVPLLLPLEKLILDLMFLSLSFLSLFRTPLKIVSPDLGVEPLTLFTFLTDTLFDLSLKLSALNRSVLVLLELSRPLDFCFVSGCLLSLVLASLSQLFSRFNNEWVREFFLEIDRFLVWEPEGDWLSVEPDACLWTFLRIEPTNFRQSWLPSGGGSLGALSMFTFSPAILDDLDENMLTMLYSVFGVRSQKSSKYFVHRRRSSGRFTICFIIT